MIAVLDKAENGDARNIGSNNSMGWKLLRKSKTSPGAGPDPVHYVRRN
jgi:hypothetical protein